VRFGEFKDSTNDEVRRRSLKQIHHDPRNFTVKNLTENFVFYNSINKVAAGLQTDAKQPLSFWLIFSHVG